jgi:hypothetical protein
MAMGNSTRLRNGQSRAFNMATTITTRKAVPKLSIWIPSNSQAIKSKPRAAMTQVIRNRMTGRFDKDNRRLFMIFLHSFMVYLSPGSQPV